MTSSAPAAGRFLYKVLATRSRAGVVTVPLTFPLPQTDLDAKDGFIHLSVAPQVEGVLERFFKIDSEVTLIKFDRKKIETFKIVRWEGSSPNGPYPHLYGADLEQSEVERDGIRQIAHESGETWKKALHAVGPWLAT